MFWPGLKSEVKLNIRPVICENMTTTLTPDSVFIKCICSPYLMLKMMTNFLDLYSRALQRGKDFQHKSTLQKSDVQLP
ncbi:hypothetical protein T4B_10033 [Trichinella pseudospiralis]|uniref:Uncharacterized protein n=2 Tax=Trichinella pseudospiralis TaxID=6337 RepID=A0A0V1E4K7_TRIPS|nr:hypothetical protein T4E_10804 [Trichinella pseudospiralis]KRY68566.1 hypothetical protein T4A_2755 [Trichinella pseudospiralis]KRY84164.1 hypothetical protein T4D_5773 [Trichinella pseudospiralis]KRZ27403.1 hypothetical protein T4B_10033 [Trichinella pseudospiralis]KRZ37370.1 hypothetical protein T4C_7269 [Trichinella pseudospiralis]